MSNLDTLAVVGEAVVGDPEGEPSADAKAGISVCACGNTCA